MMDDTAQTLLNDWDDLYDRLQIAERTLQQMADESGDAHGEASRLSAKAQGVALAIDYMRGYPDRAFVELPSGRHPDEHLIDIILTSTPIKDVRNARSFINLLRERGVRIELAQ